MPGLGDLPVDVFLCILDNLKDDRPSLNNLALTCRDLHNLANPTLYRKYAEEAYSWAAKKYNEATLRRALSYSAAIPGNSQPLFEAIQYHRPQFVKMLLHARGEGANLDIEARNHQGFTPLEAAVHIHGHMPASIPPTIIKLLLDAGANTQPRERGNTADCDYDGSLLRYAVKYGSAAAVQHLIASGRVDVKELSPNGWPLLIDALTDIMQGHEATAIVEHLIKGGADVNMLPPADPFFTPLLYMITDYQKHAPRDFRDKDRATMLALLLRHGAEINFPVPNPPIRVAIKHASPTCVLVDLLLTYPALDVNYTAMAALPNAREEDRSATALTDAIESAEYSIAVRLVQRRPDLDVNKGFPLVSAVVWGRRMPLARALMETGRLSNASYRQAMEAAIREKCFDGNLMLRLMIKSWVGVAELRGLRDVDYVKQQLMDLKEVARQARSWIALGILKWSIRKMSRD
ncbi:ankyrin repeat domain-containing protein [Aspergillus mulundensis]|uniref:F-box domain-containing protein n=1 Tax=Aspergillus mulundensis TaxID=1810919 RepID=A0A3D8QUZ4_9EURO|nr:hypothetical protein DSM5745_09405 [Aspergillus mulundensis]RDW65666.1 hypothetical protein DSM5745_09405 [Aspergillus mulundensis]